MLLKYKFLIFAFVIVFPFSKSSFCQTVPDLKFDTIFPRTENGIEYVKIIEADSLKKGEIILRLKQWAINNFQYQKAALQSEDLEAGYFLYQGTMLNTYNMPKGWGYGLLSSQIYTTTYETKFTISIYVKDYKFKVVVSSITNKAISAYGVWYDVLSTTTGNRKLDSPSIPIEKAGLEAIYNYNTHPTENKYLVRLNFEAMRWRNIHTSMDDLFKSIIRGVSIKQKSAFDF